MESTGCANKHPEEPGSVLVRIAYQSASVPYQEYREGQCPPVLRLDSAEGEGICSYFGFSQMAGFTPIQMEVQRASTLRGEIPGRVCLLGRDRALCKTYALPED